MASKEQHTSVSKSSVSETSISANDASSADFPSAECASSGSSIVFDKELFLQYMSMTNDLVSYIDTNCVYRAVNDAYLRAFGVKTGDIIGKSIIELVGEEYFDEEIKERFQTCLAGEQVHYDAWFQFPQLGRRYINVTYYPFNIGDEKKKGVIVRARDITPLKEAIDALERERDYTSSILDTMGGLVVGLNPEGRIVSWNKACERCTGYSFAEVEQRRVWEFLLPPQEVSSVKEVFAEIVADAIPNHHRNYWIKKNGERCYIEWSNNCIVSADGQVELIIGTGIDMSERQKAEQSLKESEERYQILFEHAADAVVVHDFEGRIIAANGCACSLLGYEREELLSLSMFHLISKFDRNDLLTFWQEEWDKFPFTENSTYRRKNGVDFPVETHCCCIEQRDGIYIMSIVRDITERLLAEKERARLQANVLQAQKLESLGVLAGGIAHDFNNLLMVILGNADLALQDIPSDSTIRSSLEDIEHAARRAADLCKQMLAYSGKGRFVVRPIDLSTVVSETIQMMEVTLEKKARVKLSSMDRLPKIEADVSQIRQLIMNLVSNACESLADEQGEIAINTGFRRCDKYSLKSDCFDETPPAGTYVFLEITDNGAGIDREVKPKIFDPFFSTKFTGRGLGLPAVMGIVRGHGGVIKVKSRRGRGTTVTVLLPTTAKVTTKETARPTPQWQGEGTVLLVDDEVRVRTIAARMLERLGFSVVTACDGLEALQIMQYHSEKFDLVILDLTMPRLNGEDTYHEIRNRGYELPVVLSSGYNEQEVIRRFAGEGLSGFIQKPYQLGQLEEKLRELFDRD